MRTLYKRVLSLVCAGLMLLPVTAGAAGGTQRTSLPMGGTMVYLEMGAGRTGEVTLANNRLFQTQSASGHVSAKASEGGKTVVASINGGYFDAYSGGATVYATVIQGGEVVNGGGEKPTLVFRADGTPLIDRVKIETKIAFRGEDSATVTAYSVNAYDANNAWASYLLTPVYGRAVNVASGARIITIQDSVVTNIQVGGTVPKLNWGTTVLVMNQSAWNNLVTYTLEPQIGNDAVRKTVYTPQHDSASEWTDIVNGVGAGPLLLKDGVDMCNQNSDFTDPKQSPDYVSSRSFAAIMGDGRLVLGSASSASMRNIAQYLKGLGAVDAMALDGGASTFLSIGGSTVQSAGRNLTNVLHIVDYSSGTLPKGIQPRDFDTPSSWAAQTVVDAANAGIVPETLQNGYQKNITRKEFCQIIDALLHKKLADYDKELYLTGISYNDARAALTDTWDASVLACYRFGIINGVGNNKFSPNESLTREQAAKILMGAANKINLPGSEANTSWADESQISSWAHEGINFVVGAGIMNGTGENKFDPQGLFTREQAIATAYRMMG
ncbi:S-layer homology domain-containing protein [uncultured Agathobaculum sp.]|uniref:S-layer homology domain-containing protein n=1 Tax=uncultured Agathobaculum sp. TaxID=2048140 RepID=UPI003207941C